MMSPLQRIDPRGMFLATLLAVTLSSPLANPAMAAEGEGDRPNLLVIFTDEHNFRTLGCYRETLSMEQALMWGDAVVETPHIDSLAADGMLCTSFYATTPVCSPSGAALVSGLYPQNNGVVTNNIPLREGVRTFADVLGDRGYVTGYAGKWHVGGRPKPGWRPEVDGGFDHKKYMFNRGHYKKIFEKPNGTPYVTDYKPVGDEKSFTTDYLTDRAIEFIEDHGDEPFCYMLSIPDPHGPDKVREPYDSMYDDQEYEKPRTFKERGAAAPAWAPAKGRFLDMANYYGMVRCIDDNVGRLLSVLRERGLMEETVVVFTADHGDLRGEHGLQNKGNPYEASARAPFIAYYDGKIRAGTVVDEALGSVDFKPTILSLMGIDDDSENEGRDASTLLRTGEAPEGWEDIAFLRGTGNKRSTWLAAVTDRYKLVVSDIEKPWLFDLEKDPDELTNFFGKPGYKEVTRRLCRELIDYAEKHNDPYLKNEKIGGTLRSAAAPPEPTFEPTAAHEKRSIEGWTVYVSGLLLEREPELARRATKLLRMKLHGAGRVLPAKALKKLREVPIWLGLRDRHGRHKAACYHPSERWLREHGYNPDKAGSVDLANARNFVRWSRHQPAMVLHELAHAYHHRVLGHDHGGVRKAYRRARESGDYEDVLHIRGRTKRAYALNNHKEYFAEATEAFFGTNDFYPFVRAELKRHDPEMYTVLREAWGE